jgi:hypothetical protein
MKEKLFKIRKNESIYFHGKYLHLSFIHYFQEMEAPLVIPKYINGKKIVVVNDVGYMNVLLSNGIFIAKTAPLKIEKTKEKSGIVLYQLTLFEVNTGTEKDVIIVIPQQFSGSIRLAQSTYEEAEGPVVVWEASTPEEITFKDEINTFLSFWMRPIQTNNSFGSIPEIKTLGASTLLKWPWKEGTNLEYFNIFSPQEHLHQIRLGAGYFSLERNLVGSSLQLCSHTGKTVSAILSARESKKRKRVKAVEDQTEQQTEEGKGEEIDLR